MYINKTTMIVNELLSLTIRLLVDDKNEKE